MIGRDAASLHPDLDFIKWEVGVLDFLHDGRLTPAVFRARQRGSPVCDGQLPELHVPQHGIAGDTAVALVTCDCIKKPVRAAVVGKVL